MTSPHSVLWRQRGWLAVYDARKSADQGSAAMLYALLLGLLVVVLVVATTWIGFVAGGATAAAVLLVVPRRWRGVDVPTVRSVHAEVALEVLPLAAWRLTSPTDYLASAPGRRLLGQVVGLVAVESRYQHLLAA